MSLSCSCDYDYEPEPGDKQYIFQDASLDFEPLNTNRAKRCCSCGSLISVGKLCIRYHRFRQPYTEVEARFHNIDFECLEEPIIKIADHFHCEECGEIYLNLSAIGYECLSPSENMKETLKEYQELSGFKRKEKE